MLYNLVVRGLCDKCLEEWGIIAGFHPNSKASHMYRHSHLVPIPHSR